MRQTAKPLENWIYGKNPVVEVFRAGRRRVLEVCATSDFLQNPKNADVVAVVKKAGVRLQTVPPGQLQKTVGDVVHQNVMARVERYPYVQLADMAADLGPKEIVLALDEITDPQNFATLCRSALAFGVRAILVTQDRGASVNATVCKASAGAVEHVQIAVVVNLARALEDLKKEGFWVYGTTLKDGSQALGRFQPAERSVLVMGSEGQGLRPLTEKTCDLLIHIPMKHDFDSLNVAQAATVCLYEFSK